MTVTKLSSSRAGKSAHRDYGHPVIALRTRTAALFLALLASACGTPPRQAASGAQANAGRTAAREGSIPVDGAALYYRDIGRGLPVIVLHGGPDFDQSYLLPELDQLSDSYHLIYYDQRGRGRSAAGVQPAEVSLASDIADLDAVREHFHSDTAILLGHSWGADLALEYALRHPDRVARLILLNPAPASAADLALFKENYAKTLGPDLARQKAIVAGTAYQDGDPAAVTARYRIHFKPALMRPADFEKLMTRMNAAFIRQGKDGIIKARAIEARLMSDSWQLASYDLLSRIRTLNIPILVISGDHDFIPPVIAEHIGAANSLAHVVILGNCGHFSYLECPSAMRQEIDKFMGVAEPASPPQ